MNLKDGGEVTEGVGEEGRLTAPSSPLNPKLQLSIPVSRTRAFELQPTPLLKPDQTKADEA